MARQFGWALALVVLLGSSAPAGTPAAAGPQSESAPKVQSNSGERRGNQNRRRWWKDEPDVSRLGLTPKQSGDIDAIYREWFQQARPKREVLDRLEKELDRTAAAQTEDVEVFARMVEDVENRRAELNKLRYVMLYRIHRVLSREQYDKLKAMEEAHRKKQDGDRRR